MKIDPARTVTANLLALLQERYPNLTVTADQVTFGTPTPFNDPTGVSNTQITMTAVKNKGFKGSVVLKYKRLTFEQVFPRMTTTVPVNQGDTVSMVTTKVNQAMEALYTEFVLAKNSTVTLPTPTNQTTALVASAVDSSKVFLDSVSKNLSLTYVLPVVDVTYSSSGNNLNTLTMLGSPTAAADYRLTITGTIGSASASVAALTVGALPAGSKLTIINKGLIFGAGGAGGAYNTPGVAGGVAINSLMNYSLDTSAGRILGGGGGGGGAANAWNGLLGLGAGYLRSAGGGGAGFTPGIAGVGTAVQGGNMVQTQLAANGTASGGGVGSRTQNSTNTAQFSQGGQGGLPGEPGGTGTSAAGSATGVTLSALPGGVAGKAIELGGKVVTITAGNNSTQIKGPVS